MRLRFLLPGITALGLMAQTLVPPPMKPPAPHAPFQLPQVTEAQHWDRVSWHFLLMFCAFVAREREQGKSIEDISAHWVRLVGEGWPKEMGPQSMLTAMYRNFTMLPKTQFEVLEATDAKVRFRTNRPYLPYFGKTGEIFGTKVEDYELGIALFHKALAEARGMTCECKREGDFLVYDIQRKAAAK